MAEDIQVPFGAGLDNLNCGERGDFVSNQLRRE
jgi:hypothetical protein